MIKRSNHIPWYKYVLFLPRLIEPDGEYFKGMPRNTIFKPIRIEIFHTTYKPWKFVEGLVEYQIEDDGTLSEEVRDGEPIVTSKIFNIEDYYYIAKSHGGICGCQIIFPSINRIVKIVGHYGFNKQHDGEIVHPNFFF